MGMGDLFRPKWRHSNADVRCQAVATLTDQEILAHLVLEDTSAAVRWEAANRVTDETTLVQLARNPPDLQVRLAAVKRLAAQEALAGFALNDPSPELRSLAARQISEDRALAQVATESKDNDVRFLAVNRIRDPGVLAAVLQSTGSTDMVKTIEGKVVQIVSEQLEVPVDRVTSNALLTRDLGADSLSLVELVLAVEETYCLQISDQNARTMSTVDDIVRYVEARHVGQIG
jgi:acyl carrier protein